MSKWQKKRPGLTSLIKARQRQRRHRYGSSSKFSDIITIYYSETHFIFAAPGERDEIRIFFFFFKKKEIKKE